MILILELGWILGCCLILLYYRLEDWKLAQRERAFMELFRKPIEMVDQYESVTT